MKLFRQLIARDTAPQKPENKIEKLEAEPQEALEALVAGSQGDPDDMELRVAALKRLPYTAALRGAATSAPPALEKAARMQLAEFVDDGHLSVSQLMEDIGESETRLAIASYCKTNALQDAVMAGIQDQKVLAQMCINASSAAVRKALVERIDNPALFPDLLTAFKNKDKTAYKIIKIKVDRIKAEKDAQVELQTRIASLCARIEQHSQRVFDKDYIFRMESYARRWSEVEEYAEDSDKKRFATALNLCQECAQEKQNEQHELGDRDIILSESVVNRKALLNELWEQLLAIYGWDLSDETRQEKARATLKEQQEKWEVLKESDTPSEGHAKQYSVLRKTLDDVLHQFAEKGTLLTCLQRIGLESEEPSAVQEEEQEPSEEAIHYLQQLLAPLSSLKGFKLDDTLAEAQSVVKAYAAKKDAVKKELREVKQKQLRSIGGLIRKSLGAVQQGRLKQAVGIRHSIDEKLESLNGLPGSLSVQLESLDEALQKLIDWQAYAVVPKKEALVESMKALVGADLPPEALATKIKKLQAEWKPLNQSGKDRHEDLWKSFNEAADKAYEPCKNYYQELSVVRKHNLEKRQTLVKQLQDYFQENDWDNADWPQVEKILHTARHELYSYAPVERGASKLVQDAFDGAMSAIQNKLETEFAKNKHAKEQVIAQAEKLADMADLDQAMEIAKRLQAQWKNIGRCNYKENERLWKKFRQHCDNIFSRKEKLASEQNAALSENLTKANTLIDSLKHIMTLSGDEFLATRTERDQIKQAFQEVGGLPAKADKATHRSFIQTLEGYDNKVRQQLQRAEQDAWQTLFSINAEINAYQIAALDDPQTSVTKDAIIAKISNINRWPEAALTKIKGKLERQPEGSPEANLKALTLLCIRAEILTDVASPADDKALRMEYQISLLQKGLGQVVKSSPESLALEWVEVGPVAAEDYQVLYQRFNALWQKLV